MLAPVVSIHFLCWLSHSRTIPLYSVFLRVARNRGNDLAPRGSFLERLTLASVFVDALSLLKRRGNHVVLEVRTKMFYFTSPVQVTTFDPPTLPVPCHLHPDSFN